MPLFFFLLVSVLAPPNAQSAYLYGSPVAHPALHSGNYHTALFRLSETHQLNLWSFTYSPGERFYVLARDPQSEFLFVLSESTGQLGWMPSVQIDGLHDVLSLPTLTPSFTPDYLFKYPVISPVR